MQLAALVHPPAALSLEERGQALSVPGRLPERLLGLLDVGLQVPRDESQRRPARLHQVDVRTTRPQELGGVDLVARAEDGGERMADLVELARLETPPSSSGEGGEFGHVRDEPRRRGRQFVPLAADTPPDVGRVDLYPIPDLAETAHHVVEELHYGADADDGRRATELLPLLLRRPLLRHEGAAAGGGGAASKEWERDDAPGRVLCCRGYAPLADQEDGGQENIVASHVEILKGKNTPGV